MLFIIGLFVVGIVPAVIVWTLTRRSTPARAATYRAACISLCFVPTLAPMVHGAIPVPGWFVLTLGPIEMTIRGIAVAMIIPAIAFAVIRVWMKGQLEQEER